MKGKKLKNEKENLIVFDKLSQEDLESLFDNDEFVSCRQVLVLNKTFKTFYVYSLLAMREMFYSRRMLLSQYNFYKLW